MKTLLSNLSLKSYEKIWTNILWDSTILKAIKKGIEIFHEKNSILLENSIIAKYCQQIALFFTLVLIFLSPLVSTEKNAILVIIAALFTLLKIFLNKIQLQDNILLLSVLLYMAVGLVAVGFSPYFSLAVKGYLKMIIYFIAYLIFLSNLNNLNNIKITIWTLVIIATIVSINGFIQFHWIKPPPLALWDDPETLVEFTRVYSFLGNPNLLAGYLIPCIAMSIVFYFVNSGWKKLIILLSLFFQISCLYYTYSRGSWIGLFLSILAISYCLLNIHWTSIKKSRACQILLISICIFIIVVGIYFIMTSESIHTRFLSLFAGREHSSNSFRLNVWLSTLQMIKDNWIIGIGPGNDVYKAIYAFYMVPGFTALGAYCIFLEVAVELGIIGFITFLWMLFIHCIRALWGIFQEINYSLRLLLTGCLGAIIGLMGHGLVDTVWYRPQVQILFWFMMALITILSRYVTLK